MIRGDQRSSVVIGGRRRSSEVIGGHQRSSEVVGGPRRLSEVISGRRRSSEVLGRSSEGHQRSSPMRVLEPPACLLARVQRRLELRYLGERPLHRARPLVSMHAQLRRLRADPLKVARVPDEGGHQRSSEVIRGHQRSSEVICSRSRACLMKEVIRGHQRSSEAITYPLSWRCASA